MSKIELHRIDLSELLKALEDYRFKKLAPTNNDKSRMLESFIRSSINEFQHCDLDYVTKFNSLEELDWYNEQSEGLRILYNILFPVFKKTEYPDVSLLRKKDSLFLILKIG